MKDLENFGRLLLRLKEPFLSLSAEQVKQLHEHFLLLQVWSRVGCRTGMVTMEEVVDRPSPFGIGKSHNSESREESGNWLRRTRQESPTCAARISGTITSPSALPIAFVRLNPSL